MKSPLPPIIERLAHRLYGSPIVRNAARGELVEEIVATALEPQWQLTGDWGECDLKHSSGLRIQVKQSAACQSWHRPGDRPSRGHFSTAYKTGRFEDDGSWTAERSRNADIFIFAWHPITDDTAITATRRSGASSSSPRRRCLHGAVCPWPLYDATPKRFPTMICVGPYSA